MNVLTKLIIATALIVAGFTANAATYYDSKGSCEAAWRAEKAVDYKPTAKHTKYGDDRVQGLSLRGIEGDACVLLGAQPGKRWVFLKQGTQVYTRGPGVVYLAECQNDIYEVLYLKKDESAPAPAPSQKKAEVDQPGLVFKAFCEAKFNNGLAQEYVVAEDASDATVHRTCDAWAKKQLAIRKMDRPLNGINNGGTSIFDKR